MQFTLLIDHLRSYLGVLALIVARRDTCRSAGCTTVVRLVIALFDRDDFPYKNGNSRELLLVNKRSSTRNCRYPRFAPVSMLRYFCVKIPQATATASVSTEDSAPSASLRNSNYCMVLALVRPTSNPYEVFNFVIDIYFSFDSLANLVMSMDGMQESKKEELIAYMRRFSVRYDQVVAPMKDALDFYTNLGFHSTVLQSSTELDVTCCVEKLQLPLVDQLLANFRVGFASLFVNVEHFMVLDFRRFSTRKYYRHISRILNWLNRSVSTCLRGYVNREIFSHVLRLSHNVSVMPEEEEEIDVCGTVIDKQEDKRPRFAEQLSIIKDRARLAHERAELRRVAESTVETVLATPPEETRVLRKRRAPTVPLLLKRKKGRVASTSRAEAPRQ